MNLNFTMVVQAIVFALFIWFTVKFAWPMFLSKVDARTQAIAAGLAEAERGKGALAEAQKESERLIQEARARAQEIVAQAEKQAVQRVEESKSAAKLEADRVTASATAALQQEVQSARQQLREQVAQLAVAGAEKILNREVDARAHADMLSQLKAQL
jgi:F-type H+-transporting ATPase subunit b